MRRLTGERSGQVETSIAKHSILIDGRKTSVSLEDAFWRALRKIALAGRTSVSRIISDIDKARGKDRNLSSTIRVFVLDHYVSKLEPLMPTETVAPAKGGSRSLLEQTPAS